MGTRHGTDPGIGIEHEHDKHCQRCIVLIAEHQAVCETVVELRAEVAELLRKRARSEGRDEYRDSKARSLGKGGIALGVGAWIPQIVELVQKLAGG